MCRAKKYAARSEFCSVALLFSRLVHCLRRVLELPNDVTSHNSSQYATISLKNQQFDGKPGAPNENIVQNPLNIALLNVF